MTVAERRKTSEHTWRLYRPLLKRARAEGAWLYDGYYRRWASPLEVETELKTHWVTVKPERWALKDPATLLATAESAVEVAQRELDRLRKRMADDFAYTARRQNGN